MTAPTTNERVKQTVGACTVTHNDAEDLEPFVDALESAFGESGLTPRLYVVDCDSSDSTVAELQELARSRPWVRLDVAGENLGFAGGMNRALSAARAEGLGWAWSLNADTRPAPDALQHLLQGMQEATRRGVRVGAVTPRIVRFDPRTLDACGMVLRHAWRHLDRGSEERDQGQYAEPELVFGGTGAATLYRLEALRDVALPELQGLPGGDFDPAFHSYREDAELAFRLQRRGWSTLYWPASSVAHRRVTTPERRSSLPDAINRHSLKNRYILRWHHQTLGNALGRGASAWLRDLGIAAWVLLRERSSLGAYTWLWHHRRALAARRRWLAARDTSSTWQRWFVQESEPLP